MAVDRVESLRAYRTTLQRRFDQMTHAALEGVPGGEWDGMDVLRRAELERIIHEFAEADPEPLPTVGELQTPGRLFLDAMCPRCNLPTRLLVELHTELLTTDEGSEIRAKAKSKASAHTCGQLQLEPAGEPDEEQLRLGDLTGTTEPTLILATDVPRPADVSLEIPEDERCGAEGVIPDPEEPDADLTLVCERPADHDLQPDDAEGRDHWAEGGFGWHYEERPVLTEETPRELPIEPDGGPAGPWPDDEQEDTGAES